MIRINRSGEFDSMLRELRLSEKQNYLVAIKKIKLFTNNPADTRLKNHELKRKMKGKWAFSITGNIRVVYEWQSKKVVRFLAIGRHPQVYR